jgi:ABC-type multidrug transport system ATPase subunit
MDARAEAPSTPSVTTTSITTLGRHAANSVVLDHLRVSLCHAEISLREDGGAVLRDLGSTHGTYRNGERVARLCLLRAGDRIGIGPYTLTFDGARVIRDERWGVALVVRGLTRTTGTDAIILNGIALDASAGELVVIAGESGAGKTSVLRALLGLDPARCDALIINGVAYPRLPEWLRGLAGYVSQENYLPPTLPLRRALYFVGRLRAARDVRNSDLHPRIAGLLRQLRLWDQRDQRVRTLSTGELRRANLAAELICPPPLLLLDEPTSGIDPHFRLELVERLRELARQGTTIIMASHDTREVHVADKLAMLAKGGRLAYFGTPADALERFGVASYEAIYARLASAISIMRGEGDQASAVPTMGMPPEPASPSPLPLPLRHERVESRATPRAALADVRARGRALAFQFAVLARQYGETVFADTWYLAFLLLQAPIIALMVALVSQNYAFVSGDGPFEAQKTLFFMIVAAAWFGIINALREISKERQLLLRQRLAGMSVGAYVLSKLAVLGSLCIAQSAMLTLIVLGKTGVPPASASLYLPVAIEVFIGITLAGLAGVALGLCVSAFGGSSDRVMGLAPLILLPQILFAGVIFVVNGPVQVPADVTISYWAMRATGTSVDLDHLYYEQLTTIYPVLRDHPDFEHSPGVGRVPPFRPQDYDIGPTLRRYHSIMAFDGPWNDAHATRRQNLVFCWAMLASLIVGFSLLAYMRLRVPASPHWPWRTRR